jgi:hypothetical protein
LALQWEATGVQNAELMQALQTVNIDCAFCGERIEILIDCSLDYQQYVEDCQVCCRPLVLSVQLDADGMPDVAVRFEDE